MSQRNNNDAPRQQARVLYVEDNPANLGLLKHIVSTQTPYELVAATTPSEALALVETLKFDLIILDINLPEMDGYELLECMRSLENSKDVTIIALTANAMEEDIERGLQAGFFRYITKPFTVEDILQTIGELLADKH